MVMSSPRCAKRLAWLGHKLGVEAQHVVDYLHLSIAERASPDADGGYGQLAGNYASQGGGHQLQDHSISTRILQRMSVQYHLRRLLGYASLGVVATEAVY